MEKHAITFADKGDATLLVLSVPDEFSAKDQLLECYAIPVLSRSGGLLLNIPRGVVSDDVLIDALQGADEDALFGPSKGVLTKLCEEDDERNVVVRPENCSSLVVDFSDSVLDFLREYDPSQEQVAELIPFLDESPAALPVFSEVLTQSLAWVQKERGSDRVNFYSAQEDPPDPTPKTPDAKSVASKKVSQAKRVTNAQVLDQLTVLMAQMKQLSMRQDVLEQGPVASAAGPSHGNTGAVPSVSAGLPSGKGPPVAFSKLTKLVGPPPKVRAPFPPVAVPEATPAVENAADPPGDLMSALTQQSSAVLALVSHLANQSDPVFDLHGQGQYSTTTRGVQKREKMQSDLAQGTSTYYLQMMVQLHKKMFPARPLPKSESELGHLSFLEYLEKTGGYRQNREAAFVMWLLGHVIDAAAVEDYHMVRERLALMAIAMEQSIIDKNDWSVAFLLSLATDPPVSMFQDRASVLSPYGQPFASLVPPSWPAAVLSYIKELEVLGTKKSDAASPKKKSAAPSDDAAPSPKRKPPRFPKKPKAEAPQ